MATIKYKGESKEIKITNRALMAFELAGGKLSDFENNPVSNSIKLACACLGIEGDALEHADDLPSLKEISDSISDALKESGLEGEQDPKK
jgi:hypothetical protein